jgi:hypothetical protein
MLPTTLKEPLSWINSTLLKGDAREAVAGSSVTGSEHHGDGGSG